MLSDVQDLIVPATSRNRPNTEAELAQVEHQVGTLPKELRRLLAEHGSFAFDEDVLVTGTPLGDLPIFVFFSATEPYSILKSVEAFDELRPRRLIPFADNGFADRFAYSQDDQSVWFVDTTDDRGISQIFPSFERFLDALAVDPDSEE